jgi:hypothetical protein
VWLYIKKNSALRQRLMPLVMTQMVAAHLGSADERPVDDSASEALQLWAAAWENVGRCGEEVKQAEQSLAAAEAALKKTGDGIATNSREVKARKQHRQQKLEALAALAVEEAATIASGGWGEALIEHGQRIITIKKEIERHSANRPPKSGGDDRVITWPGVWRR